MGRKKGLDIAGAYYYVELNSGARRKLFDSSEDYQSFLPLLAELQHKHQSRTLAWCLLQNSIHLLVKAGPEGLSTAINSLKKTYTEQSNLRNTRSGSLFTTANNCTLIEPSEWLLPAVRHIHQLPLQHKLVPELSIYPWSSHENYRLAQGPNWLDWENTLNKIAQQRAGRLARYENFIRSVNPPDVDWVNGTHSQFRALAEPKYVAQVMEKEGERINQSDSKIEDTHPVQEPSE